MPVDQFGVAIFSLRERLCRLRCPAVDAKKRLFFTDEVVTRSFTGLGLPL